MNPKVYPLEVQAMGEIESGGGEDWYWSKGHHDPAAFAAACEREFVVCINPAAVEHQYMRWTPYGREKGQMCAYHTKGPGAGAFPVTIIELWRKDAYLPPVEPSP